MTVSVLPGEYELLIVNSSSFYGEHMKSIFKLRHMALPSIPTGTWNGRGNSYLHQAHMPLIFPAGTLVGTVMSACLHDLEMIS